MNLKVLNWLMLTYFWLRYSKTGTKKVQLVFQHCSKKSWKAMLRVLPPTFKLSCNKSDCCRLPKICCRKYRVVLLFASVYVARLPAQGKLVLQQVTWCLCMAWLPHNLIQSEVSIYSNCSNLYLFQYRFERGW